MHDSPRATPIFWTANLDCILIRGKPTAVVVAQAVLPVIDVTAVQLEIEQIDVAVMSIPDQSPRSIQSQGLTIPGFKMLEVPPNNMGFIGIHPSSPFFPFTPAEGKRCFFSRPNISGGKETNASSLAVIGRKSV